MAIILKYNLLVKSIFIILFVGFSNIIFAQGIAINSTGAPPEASTVLDIASMNKGFLAPRVTLTGTTDVTTIASAAVSLLVYNTATVSDVTPGYYYWTGSVWKRWLNSDPLDNNWDLTGNTNTVPGTNFLGTTDNIALSFRTNNVQRFRLINQTLEVRNSSRGVYLGEGAATSHLWPAGSFGAIAIGYEALKSVTASTSFAIGYRALKSVTDNAGNNTAIGNESLTNLIASTAFNASGNTAIGSLSLASATTTTGCSAIGDSALYSVTTNGSNAAIGHGAMRDGNPSTSVAVGSGALKSINSVSGAVIGIGLSAGASLTTGVQNIAIGNYALLLNTSSTNNVAIGYEAGRASNSGSNTFVGYQAGRGITGTANVCIGYQAGASETAIDNRLFIDNSNTSTPLISGDFANDRVGFNRVASSNTLEISGTASKVVASGWAANSDKRIKTDIKDIENGIETIMKLHPVKFKYTDEWKERNPILKENNHYYYNYIAQEFREVFPDAVKGSGEFLQNDIEEILQVDTYNAQIVSVKAIQEQQALIEEQKKLLEELKNTVEEERKKLNQQTKEVEKLEKIYSDLSSEK